MVLHPVFGDNLVQVACVFRCICMSSLMCELGCRAWQHGRHVLSSCWDLITSTAAAFLNSTQQRWACFVLLSHTSHGGETVRHRMLQFCIQTALKLGLGGIRPVKISKMHHYLEIATCKRGTDAL